MCTTFGAFVLCVPAHLHDSPRHTRGTLLSLMLLVTPVLFLLEGEFAREGECKIKSGCTGNEPENMKLVSHSQGCCSS